MNDTSPIPPPAHVHPAMLWSGRVLSALVVLGLTFSAVLKLLAPEFILKEFDRLGYHQEHALGVGVLELVCMILYAIPQTSILGAVLLTGYLGGATATHVRIGDNFASPVVFGVLVWLGLYLRDRRWWPLLPLRRPGRM